MIFDPQIHRRQSIRLKGYDYTQEGAYFVTICTHEQQHLFGEIVNGKMRLNEYGRIVRDEWNRTAQIRSEIEIDEFIIMPNHFHGIIVIIDCGHSARRGTARRARTDADATTEHFGTPVSGSIPTIVRSFKSAVSKRINAIRNTPAAQVWQRNYYEHVVRDELDLHRIREYIHTNVTQWGTGTACRAQIEIETKKP